MTTTAIYLRMSQDREGREYGVDRQEAECRKLAERHGIAPDSITIYVDNDISASTRSNKKRPAYARMVSHARDGKVQTILSYSLSRVTRRPREGEDLILLAESNGLQIRTVASGDPDLTRADGRALFRTLMAWDAAEAERISERVTLQAAQRAQHGRNMGGARRFGYSVDGSELVAEEAEAIRWAFDAVIAGASIRSIAAEWKARGLTGSKGAPLDARSVRQTLLRAQNAGLSIYHGEIVGTSLSPAIVSVETWNEACEILRDPARKVKGRPAAGMMAGLLKCGKCGSPAYGRNKNGRAVYYCHAAGHITRNRDAVDAMVTALLLSWLADNREFLREPVAEATDPAIEEIARLRDRLDRLARLLHAETLDPEDYAAACAPLRASLKALEARAVVEARRPATAALVSAESLPEAWEALTLEERRTVLRECLASVTMLPVNRRGIAALDPEHFTTEWLPLSRP